MKPLVAIVGRANVGKSTLFNRLAGHSLAIVDDQPGVTRDRHYADAHVTGRDIVLVDTGGFDPAGEDPLGRSIARQVEIAIAEADVVVCVFDGASEPVDADRRAVELLRRTEQPTIFVANKIDTQDRTPLVADFYALGVNEILPVSSLHGRGTGELLQAICGALPEQPEPAADLPPQLPRLALVGRPNAGKSSLLNRLSKQERSLVDARPGTTRDPIDAVVEYKGAQMVVVDTAGVRRRTKVDRGVEAVSAIRAIRSIARAEVTVLVCDASEGLSEQDTRLLGLAIDRRRAVIVALNKFDLLEPRLHKRALEQAQTRLHFAPWVPVLGISAKTGHGLSQLMSTAQRGCDEFRKRVPTGELNRFFEQVLEHHSPPTRGGHAPRIYYITQAQTEPPLFVAMSSAPEHIAASYQRFVANQIRKAFGFEMVPIVVQYRGRGRKKRT